MKRSLATGSRMPRLTDSSAWRNSSGSESVGTGRRRTPARGSVCRTPPLRSVRFVSAPIADQASRPAKATDYRDLRGEWQPAGRPGAGGSVRRAEGQADLEQGALAAGTLDADRASVDGHDLLGHEQSDARPPVRLGGTGVHHEELLEDPIVELGGDTDSIVADPQNDLVVIRFQPDIHLAARGSE